MGMWKRARAGYSTWFFFSYVPLLFFYLPADAKLASVSFKVKVKDGHVHTR